MPRRERELAVGPHIRTRRQRLVIGRHRLRRVVQRHRRLEEAGVKVARQRAHHLRPLRLVVDVDEGVRELRWLEEQHLGQQPIEGRDRAHAGRAQQLHARFDREVVQRRAVEGHQDHLRRAELGERATGLHHQVPHDRIGRAPRPRARAGLDADLEVRAEQQRPIVFARQLLVHLAGDPDADQPIVMQRQMRPVVLDRIHRQVHRRTAAHQPPRFLMWNVEQRDHARSIS